MHYQKTSYIHDLQQLLMSSRITAEVGCSILKCLRYLQYGSTDYHKQSLRNVQEAVRRTRRLCAVVLDTFGRELVIRREYEVDEQVRYRLTTGIATYRPTHG